MATLIELLPIWVAVWCTLAIYSFLYGENPWYRLAEHIYAGVSVGYQVAFNLDYLRDQWVNRWSLEGGLMVIYVICILIGLLWYARFFKQYFHFYRWTLAIIVGTGIGMALRTVIFTQFLNQIIAQASMPLFVAGDMTSTISNILIAIMTPSVLLYFWFTGGAREGGPMDYVRKIARYTIMAGFGSAYGYTVLTRYSLFIGRAQFLLGNPPNPPEARMAFYTIAAVMLITLFGYDLVFKKKD
jgi:hypothetical protein